MIGWRARRRGMCANSSTEPAELPVGAPAEGGIWAGSVMSSRRREPSTTLALTRPFRYVRSMSPRPHLGLAVAALALALPMAGCRPKAKTPVDGYKRLAAAVNTGDGGALFDA